MAAAMNNSLFRRWRDALAAVNEETEIYRARMCFLAAKFHNIAAHRVSLNMDSDIVITDSEIEYSVRGAFNGGDDWYSCKFPLELLYYAEAAALSAAQFMADEVVRLREEKQKAEKAAAEAKAKGDRRKLYDKLRAEFAGEQATLDLL